MKVYSLIEVYWAVWVLGGLPKSFDEVLHGFHRGFLRFYKAFDGVTHRAL